MKLIVSVFVAFLAYIKLGEAQFMDSSFMQCQSTDCINIPAMFNKLKNNQELSNPCLCVLGCIAKSKGIFTPDYQLNADEFKKFASKWMPAEKLENVISKCNPVGATDCDAAKSFVECAKSVM